jgi:regulatory protein
MNSKNEKLTPSAALDRVKKTCARREYCQQDARNKFYEFGLYPNEVEDAICNLIDEDFINEERYACSYANDKVKLSHWGWRKVEAHLKQKQISSYCIKKARKYVPLTCDEIAFQTVAENKWEVLSSHSFFKRKDKFTSYMLQRGFSYEQINSFVKEQKDG